MYKPEKEDVMLRYERCQIDSECVIAPCKTIKKAMVVFEDEEERWYVIHCPITEDSEWKVIAGMGIKIYIIHKSGQKYIWARAIPDKLVVMDTDSQKYILQSSDATYKNVLTEMKGVATSILNGLFDVKGVVAVDWPIVGIVGPCISEALNGLTDC